ncbi:hypothetical protein, partial [Moorena sp. SIO4G3]|uniref:hypothetical protein n=1 Tax=Moorena sp. SIO4G3 TaxID=2607821 RepID=UPI00142A26CF
MVFNPTTCEKKIKAQGNHPCPGDNGTGMSYHCNKQQTGTAIWDLCNVGDVREKMYHTYRLTEVYNFNKCRDEEYDFEKCEERVFTNQKEAKKWIKNNGGKDKWDTRDCYCCCGCYAYGTPIATPDGEKAIEEFQIGDLVSVAN